MRSRRGQNILEYVIIFAAIVAAVIYGATTFIRPAVQDGLNDTAESMKSATSKLLDVGN